MLINYVIQPYQYECHTEMSKDWQAPTNDQEVTVEPHVLSIRSYPTRERHTPHVLKILRTNFVQGGANVELDSNIDYC